MVDDLSDSKIKMPSLSQMKKLQNQLPIPHHQPVRHSGVLDNIFYYNDPVEIIRRELSTKSVAQHLIQQGDIIENSTVISEFCHGEKWRNSQLLRTPAITYGTKRFIIRDIAWFKDGDGVEVRAQMVKFFCSAGSIAPDACKARVVRVFGREHYVSTVEIDVLLKDIIGTEVVVVPTRFPFTEENGMKLIIGCLILSDCWDCRTI